MDLINISLTFNIRTEKPLWEMLIKGVKNISKSNPKQSRHLKRFSYTVDRAVEKPFNWQQMLRLLAYLKPYSKNYLPGAIIAMLVSTAVRLIVPILIGKVAIDIAVANKTPHY